MVSEIISEYFLENKRTPLEHKNRLYPTSASCFVNYSKFKKLQGNCLRASYYDALGILPEKDNFIKSREMKKEFGKYIERMLLDILSKQGTLKEKNIPFLIDEYNISGKIDAIITKNSKDFGLEIKTVSGSNTYLNSMIFQKNIPKWKDLFQTLIYTYAKKDELINGFILYYLRLDTCEEKEFKIQIEPLKGKLYPIINDKVDTRFSIDDILLRYKILKQYIDLNKTPPREYIKEYSPKTIKDLFCSGYLSKSKVDKYSQKPFGDIECEWCEYETLCDRDL